MIAILLLAISAWAGECAARKLNHGEALDHECKLFRVVDGWIELPQHAVWKRVEKIDCSKATREDGVLIYHARSVAAEFYCPAGGVGSPSPHLALQK